MFYWFVVVFVSLCYVEHRDLYVLTHSFPTRSSSDLLIAEGKKIYTVRAAGAGDSAFQGSTDLAQAVTRLQPMCPDAVLIDELIQGDIDRKSTRLNSSH